MDVEKFEKPEMEIIWIETEDVIYTSGGGWEEEEEDPFA